MFKRSSHRYLTGRDGVEQYKKPRETLPSCGASRGFCIENGNSFSRLRAADHFAPKARHRKKGKF
jgi:hypothetical protein